MPLPTVQDKTVIQPDDSDPLFILTNADLIAKEGTDQDLWWLISHLESEGQALNVVVQCLLVAIPSQEDQETVIATIVAVDPASSNPHISEQTFFPVVTACRTLFDVRTPTYTFGGNSETIHMTGTVSCVQIDLTLKYEEPFLANTGADLFPLQDGLSYQYAFTNMKTQGSMTINGKRYEVTGSTWFDRQWETVDPEIWIDKRWSWIVA